MSPRFVLGRENVPCVTEVVNRSLKADCTDFNKDSTSAQDKAIADIYRNKFSIPLDFEMLDSAMPYYSLQNPMKNLN